MKGGDVPVTLLTYETICAIYGNTFAQTWFRPISTVQKTD
jgi:hypothetical protein